MKVCWLRLNNYGRFDDLTMEFAPNNKTKGNVTIIVGNNGAGKSQILQALATGFSWFVNGLKNKSDGFEIDKKFIKNGFNDICVNISTNFNNKKVDTDWQFMTVRDGRNSSFKNKMNELNNIIDDYRTNLTKNNSLSLPLIVYYPVERSIIGNSQADILSNEFDQLDAYFACVDGVGIDIYDFLKWFRQQEDIENEFLRFSSENINKQFNHFNEAKKMFDNMFKEHETLFSLAENIEDKLLKETITKIKLEKERNDMLLSETEMIKNLYDNNELRLLRFEVVKQAISLFTDFKNIRIERQGTPKMVVEKDGEKLDVNQLSQGEKSLLALVGDIARRLAILNPSLENPLQGEGVVLIDEVDLHLHPKWQQNLIDKLTKTFPNVQFILTTHSPHIVSDNPDVLVYILDNGELRPYHNAYGEDANTLLNGVFGVSERTPEIAEKFKLIGDYISDMQLDNAKNLIDELSKILPKNHTQLLSTQLSWAKAKLTQSKET